MAWRAALIGCGKIGSEFADDPRIRGILTHAEAYSVCADTELVAVADVSSAAAERCRERWGVARSDTDSLRMLAEAQPEIVSICSPDETHYALIQAALRTPGMRAVLAEKPLAITPAEARELVEEAAAQGILLAVNYSRRYATGHMALRDAIRSGRLGRIQRVSGYYTKGTLHNGSHWFDLIRFLVGEVESVQGWNALGESGADPTLDAMLHLADGTLATLAALDSREFSLFEMDIVGTLGRARLVDSGHWIDISAAADSPYYSGYRTLVAEERMAGGLEDVTLRAVEDLVRCLKNGEGPACSGQDGLHALEIGFALHASARRGGAQERPGA
jgi:predicted dehydrogenase